MMTEAEIQEIEGRLSAATPGPWEKEPLLKGGSVYNNKGEVISTWGDSGSFLVLGPPQEIYEESPSKRAFTRIQDAELIAHCPTDLRSLLDERKRLAEKNRLLVDAFITINNGDCCSLEGCDCGAPTIRSLVHRTLLDMGEI